MVRRAIAAGSLCVAVIAFLGAQAAPAVIGDQQAPAVQSDGAAVSAKHMPDPLAAKLVEASELIRVQRPLDAIAILDGVIAAEQAAHASDTVKIYSSRSLSETLLYSVLGAKEKKAVIVLDGTWADALFMKGFALIDAGRRAEGGEYLKQALAMAPLNAQYLNESAEFQKHDKDFTGALATFRSAADAAEFAPDNRKDAERRRAWRGMAYVYVEQGKLDEAEALYRKCLAADPSDKSAAAELSYVAQQRLKQVHGEPSR